jgi:hypothetical protein
MINEQYRKKIFKNLPACSHSQSNNVEGVQAFLNKYAHTALVKQTAK